jgi:tetratricopeptide (TPR) repeat protein
VGWSSFPLKAFCDARDWAPVYLDEVSAVFLRRTPDTESLVERLRINCETVPIHPDEAGSLPAWRYAAAAATLARLGRYAEAVAALDKVLELKPQSAAARSMRDNLSRALRRSG